MKKTIIIHPLLLSIYPVLALFSANLNDVQPPDVIRSMLVLPIAALVLWATVWLFLRDWILSGLITTLAAILVFSYGHVYSFVEGWGVAGIVIGRNKFFLPFWGFILVYLVWWLVKKAKNAERISDFLNLASFISLIFPLYAILSYHLFPAPTVHSFAVEVPPIPANVDTQNDLPDIYYIVLDGYGRADVLADLYQYDNAEFTQFLQETGFYIADKSNSNYNQTPYSIASSLNMNYINYLTEVLGENSTDQRPLAELIQNSLVQEYIAQQGYQTVSFESGYGPTNFEHVADYYFGITGDNGPGDYFFVEAPQLTQTDQSTLELDLRAAKILFTPFESLLLELTPVRPFLSLDIFIQNERLQEYVLDPLYDLHRLRISTTLAHLADFAQAEGSYFVFAHVLAPHPPFVFGPNGEEVLQTSPFSISDGSNYPGTLESYISGYRDQVTFINSLLEKAITEILESSDNPPIIIIQGDHGPGAYLQWSSPEQTNMKERMAIFSAYYFPDGNYSALYASITPVNSFRVVFNNFFDAEFELLEDKNYFIVTKDHYDFLDVTSRLVK